MEQFSKIYDLEERTEVFGEGVITFCKTLEQDAISRPLITQIVKSATSIGANYAEANNGSSERDFKNKILISKKEAQETKHWVRMLSSCFPEKKELLRKYWTEAHELLLILQKNSSSCNKPKLEN